MSVSATYTHPDGRVESVIRRAFEFAVKSHNDNDQFAKCRLGPAFVHRFVKSVGGSDTIRVLYWENPKISGEYVVGFIQEAWARGHVREGWPHVRLYACATHKDRDVALAHRNTLASCQTFTGLLKTFAPTAKLVSENSHDLPFLPLVYWKKPVRLEAVRLTN